MTERPQASRFAYSPDGKRLAYNMGVLGVIPGIEAISSTGGRPVRILSTKIRVGSPCWSPDSDWLIYGQAGKLWKIASHGAGQPTLVKERADQRLICSPRGDSIAYTTHGQTRIMAWDGQRDRPVGAQDDYNPPGTFAERGRLLYIAKRKDQRQMDVIDVVTGKVQRTIQFELAPTDAIRGISIHPDGKRILLSAGDVPFDLWKVEGFAYPVANWTRLFRHWEVPW